MEKASQNYCGCWARRCCTEKAASRHSCRCNSSKYASSLTPPRFVGSVSDWKKIFILCPVSTYLTWQVSTSVRRPYHFYMVCTVENDSSTNSTEVAEISAAVDDVVLERCFRLRCVFSINNMEIVLDICELFGKQPRAQPSEFMGIKNLKRMKCSDIIVEQSRCRPTADGPEQAGTWEPALVKGRIIASLSQAYTTLLEMSPSDSAISSLFIHLQEYEWNFILSTIWALRIALK